MSRAMAGVTAIALLLACVAGIARAQDEPVSVAVFDFETKGGDLTADTGRKIGDLLSVFLGSNKNITVAGRDKLNAALVKLGIPGAHEVAPAYATRIGCLVGANVLVMGRAIMVNNKLYLTGMVMSAETGVKDAQLVKGDPQAELYTVVHDLADKLAAYINENHGAVLARVVTPAPEMKALQETLAKGTAPTPTVTVIIPELAVDTPANDHAAQTEFAGVARKAGVPALDASKLGLADWVKDYLSQPKTPLPDKASQADIVFVGEGHSEFDNRVKDKVTVRARLRVKAVDVKTGDVLGVSDQTVTATDASEQKAGRTALRRAASQAAVEMLPRVVDAQARLRAQMGHKDKSDKPDDTDNPDDPTKLPTHPRVRSGAP